MDDEIRNDNRERLGELFAQDSVESNESRRSPVDELQRPNIHDFLEQKLDNQNYKRNLGIAGTIIILLLGVVVFFFKRDLDNIEAKIEKVDIATQVNTNKTTELEKADIKIKGSIERLGATLLTLKGTTHSGNIVFYNQADVPEGEVKICALALDYPWNCSKETLMSYQGKKILISIENHYNISHEFTVKGFFVSDKEDGRMIQIPEKSLSKIVGPKEQKILAPKGIFNGKVIFTK